MTVTREKVVLESPAKINLSLEVLGKRGDGYHSIRSVIAGSTTRVITQSSSIEATPVPSPKGTASASASSGETCMEEATGTPIEELSVELDTFRTYLDGASSVSATSRRCTRSSVGTCSTAK